MPADQQSLFRTSRPSIGMRFTVEVPPDDPEADVQLLVAVDYHHPKPAEYGTVLIPRDALLAVPGILGDVMRTWIRHSPAQALLTLQTAAQRARDEYAH